jgi:hypothetical protein
MKKILAFIVSLLCGFSAHAQTTTADLMGLGMPGLLAAEVTKIHTGANPYLDGTTSVLLKINGTSQVTLTDGVLAPTTDNDIDLGSSSKEFKDVYVDGTIITDALNADGLIYITHSGGGILEGASSFPADVLTTAGTGPTLVSIKDTSADADNVALIGIGNHAVGSVIRLYKSRATDGSADTVVQSGDQVGNFQFYAADGTVFGAVASMRAEIDTTPGSGDTPGRLLFSTASDGSSTLTEAMRITNAQTVQIAGGKRLDVSSGLLTIPKGNTIPATCTQGEIYHDLNSNDCVDTGGGDGALCSCKSTNTWALIVNM